MAQAKLERIIEALLDVVVDLQVDIGDELERLKKLKHGRSTTMRQKNRRAKREHRRRAAVARR